LPLKGKILNTQKETNFTKVFSSEEIKNMITALGCGIGEEFDIEKIRYKKIIIMTDADVDGSHIQTLIMTFFYKYLREIIENGYLYIAQPPLYRYKKGKIEKYLKDEKELSEYLISQGIEVLDLDIGKIEQVELLKNIADYKIILSKLQKRFSLIEVIRFLVENENGDLDEYLKSIGFNILNKKGDNYFIQTNRGLEEITLDENLFNHHLFLKAKQAYEKIKDYEGLIEGDLLEVLETVEKKARSGANIQRYKGLGEMNPEQLWETTMNPENRILVQVNIDEVEQASEYFELFMGSEVEPRRDYIQTHAKDVENLDV